MIEVLKTIAILCQLSIGASTSVNSSINAYEVIESINNRQESCQTYYAKCLGNKVDALQLQKCMKKRDKR